MNIIISVRYYYVLILFNRQLKISEDIHTENTFETLNKKY